MCIAVPVQVISVEGSTALVDDGTRRRAAGCAMTPGVRPGDWALVTAGQIVAVVPADEAREAQALVRELRMEGDA